MNAAPIAPKWLQDWCRQSGTGNARRPPGNRGEDQGAWTARDTLDLGTKPEWLDDAPEGPDIAGNVHKASLPPWRPQEEARLRSALAAIPADIDGRTWASFGRALHELNWVCDGMRVPADRHAPDGTDIGLEIWNGWSKTSTGKGRGNGEYHGRADLEKRWRHFDETAGDYRAAPITIASIYHEARQRGWTDDCIPHVNSKDDLGNQQWHEDQATSQQDQTSQQQAGQTGQKQHSGRQSRKVSATPFQAFDFAKIPKRQWLYGRHYVREYVTATVAPGGGAKTALKLAEAVSMAIGRSYLIAVSRSIGCAFGIGTVKIRCMRSCVALQRSVCITS
jgi:hypothetical protein